jgi:hypothetical protein
MIEMRWNVSLRETLYRGGDPTFSSTTNELANYFSNHNPRLDLRDDQMVTRCTDAFRKVPLG